MHILSIGLLVLSLLLVWYPNKHYWVVPFIGFLGTGLLSGWIAPIALIAITTYAGTAAFYYFATSKLERTASLLILVVVSIAYASNVVPGFNQFLYIDKLWLSPNKDAVSLSFIAHSGVVGLCLLLCFKSKLLSSLSDVNEALKISVPIIALAVPTIYLLGVGMSYIEFELTVHKIVVPLFISNFFFVVIAEEVLFRGIIQNRVAEAMNNQYSQFIGLFITSLLFGLLHMNGGLQLVFLASLSGALYGYVYLKSGRIEMAMLAHITVNAGNAVAFYTV